MDKAIKEIYDLLNTKKFTKEDFKDKKYYRVAYIKWLIESGKIDNNLFLFLTSLDECQIDLKEKSKE